MAKEGCHGMLCDDGMKLTLFFLGVILVGALVFSLVNPKPVQVSGNVLTSTQQDLLYANGMAMRKVSPDLLRISLGVETQEVTASESQSSNAAGINAVKAALISNGVLESNIQTSVYDVSPVTTSRKVCPVADPECADWEAQWVQEIVGYKTTHMLTVESTGLDSAGTLVDASVRAGSNRVDSVTFTLKDATQKSIEDELASEAMADAKAKAGRIAAGLGVQVGKVTSASINSYYYPQTSVRNMVGAAEASYDGGTSFSPGQLTLTVYSSAVFEIRQ
ncbi:MAG: SIMPL domain-containing protein [Candidatus ainarchaeum sp.]|nr:SIMPL domain-containing protein [Candidatus ainarchaeum sp.]